mgnify:CR=1 FL=1
MGDDPRRRRFRVFGDDARLEVIVLETGVCLYYGTLVTVVSIIYGMSV